MGISSTVYCGVHGLTGDRVAVKILNIRGEEAKRSTKREFQLLSKLQHPNIVRVFKFGNTQAGQPWIVASCASGVSIEKAVVEAQRLLEEKTAITLTEQLTSAVWYLDQSGIVHRDIKPANVVVQTLENVHPFAVLVDFGVAHSCSTGTNVMLSNTGTVGYRAPEMLLGWIYDASVDVWGLGATIAVMVTGIEFGKLFDYNQLLRKYEGRATNYVKDHEARKPTQVSFNMRLTQTQPSAACRDFISQCIKVMPAERAKPAELLEHRWFTVISL
jgi:serine/threonine protein kinase